MCTSKDSTTKVAGQKHPWVLPNHSWGCSPCPATGVWVPPGASRGGTVPAPRSPFVRCTPSCCQQHVVPVGTENNTIGPERADFASPGPLKCRRPKPVPSRRSETWHPFRFAAPCPSAQDSCWTLLSTEFCSLSGAARGGHKDLGSGSSFDTAILPRPPWLNKQLTKKWSLLYFLLRGKTLHLGSN